MAGPKAAPKMPQALDTRLIMEPFLSNRARSRAMMVMITTTIRPTRSISLLSALPLRKTGWYTSLAKAEAEARSWESAVLMEAARMAESRMPESRAGKRLRTSWMKTSSLFSRPLPKYRKPMRPVSTEKRRIRVVQLLPITALRLHSFSERMDM